MMSYPSIDSLVKKVCLVCQGIFDIKKVRPTQGRTYNIP